MVTILNEAKEHLGNFPVCVKRNFRKSICLNQFKWCDITPSTHTNQTARKIHTHKHTHTHTHTHAQSQKKKHQTVQFHKLVSFCGYRMSSYSKLYKTADQTPSLSDLLIYPSAGLRRPSLCLLLYITCWINE